MEDIIAISIPICGMILAFAIVYVNRSASNKERLSMLEKGFSPEEISKINNKSNDPNSNLSTGLLFIGASTGILIGFLLTQISPINHILAYITCAFLFGGVGLLIAYYINPKRNK